MSSLASAVGAEGVSLGSGLSPFGPRGLVAGFSLPVSKI